MPEPPLVFRKEIVTMPAADSPTFGSIPEQSSFVFAIVIGEIVPAIAVFPPPLPNDPQAQPPRYLITLHACSPQFEPRPFSFLISWSELTALRAAIARLTAGYSRAEPRRQAAPPGEPGA